jgi:hypothetical protein
MKKRYPKLVDLIKENKLNEDPFTDMDAAFADMDVAFDKVDDKSNYLKTAAEVEPDFVKKIMNEAESKKQEILKVNQRDISTKATAAQEYMNYLFSYGITIEKSGSYLVETQDGKTTRIPGTLVSVNESLSRGSLYRKRYYGRY